MAKNTRGRRRSRLTRRKGDRRTKELKNYVRHTRSLPEARPRVTGVGVPVLLRKAEELAAAAGFYTTHEHLPPRKQKWVKISTTTRDSVVCVVDKASRRLVAMRVVKPKPLHDFVARRFGGDYKEAAEYLGRPILEGAYDVLDRDAVDPPKALAKPNQLTVFAAPHAHAARYSSLGVRFKGGNEIVLSNAAEQIMADPERIAILREYADAIAATLEMYAPVEAAQQRVALAAMGAGVGGGARRLLRNALFTSAEFVCSTPLVGHKDSGNVKGTLSAVGVLHMPNARGGLVLGGAQVLLDHGVVMTCPQGTVIFARYEEERHAVLDIDCSSGAERLAVILFNNAAVLARCKDIQARSRK